MFIGNKLRKLRTNTVFKNGILFTMFSFLNSGINFLLLIILANFISPLEYGELNLFNTFVTLLSMLISLNTTGIISVEFFKTSKQQFRKILNGVLLLSTGTLCFFTFLLLIFSHFLKLAVGLSVEYQWLALLICYLQVFSSINLDIWRLEEKPVSYGLYSVSTVLLNFILTLVLVISFQQGWLGRLYAQVGVGIVFFFISIIFLIKRGYLKRIWPDKRSIKDALHFGLPLIPHSTSTWIRQGLDRYIINYFFVTSDVGLFSFAYNFANVIQIVGFAFNATNSVFIYKNLAQNNTDTRDRLWKQTKVMLIFFFLLAILICLGTSVFIPILVPNYAGSIPYLFPLCMAAMFQCIYYLFVNYLFYYKKTKGLMFITFFMSILHFLLSLLLTRYSIMYTAYITMVINFLIAFLVFLYSRRIYKLR
ncbi:lipopolysaccharide biosynthesis protein [Parabacteroides timonensis]|uniref:lipopolysaccharide biosynthesis protein n=1 Tax=Parabacteroides timonensis TaxID=1871013 RepID=UPI0009E646E2|nr:oligosaccharide flippase family protein [Parabacteroides timonensis]